MKKTKLLIAITCFTTICLFTGCKGRSADSSYNADIQIDAHIGAERSESDTKSESGNIGGIFGTKGFVFYGEYEPMKEVLETDDLSILQLGNNIIEIGETTIGDFVDIVKDDGKYTYGGSLANIDDIIDEFPEHSFVRYWFGDKNEVMIELYIDKNEGFSRLRDFTISSINVVPVLPGGFYTETFVSEFPELHSIYFARGARYSGSIDETIAAIGEPRPETIRESNTEDLGEIFGHLIGYDFYYESKNTMSERKLGYNVGSITLESRNGKVMSVVLRKHE